MNAMLMAYNSGARTINATTIFNAMCPAIFAVLLYFCCASIFAFVSWNFWRSSAICFSFSVVMLMVCDISISLLFSQS